MAESLTEPFPEILESAFQALLKNTDSVRQQMKKNWILHVVNASPERNAMAEGIHQIAAQAREAFEEEFFDKKMRLSEGAIDTLRDKTPEYHSVNPDTANGYVAMRFQVFIDAMLDHYVAEHYAENKAAAPLIRAELEMLLSITIQQQHAPRSPSR
jgi:hypothetical protein